MINATAPILLNLTNITQTAFESYKANLGARLNPMCAYDLQKTIQNMNDSLVVLPYFIYYILLALHVVLIAYLFIPKDSVRVGLVKLALMMTIMLYVTYVPYIFYNTSPEYAWALYGYGFLLFVVVGVNALKALRGWKGWKN